VDKATLCAAWISLFAEPRHIGANLMITQRGLLRLKVRAYRVFGEALAPSRQFIWNANERLPPIKGSPQKRRMRLKQAIAVVPQTPVRHA
jgi:hypothetical protein